MSKDKKSNIKPKWKMKDDSEDSDVEKRFLDIPDDEDYML